MAELNFAESYRTNGFVVEIEGTQCPVTKVTGLTEGASGTIDQPDAGSVVGLGMTSVYTHTRADTQRREIERAVKLWSGSLEFARAWAEERAACH